MNEAQRARYRERWLEQAHEDLQRQLLRLLRQHRQLYITRQILMLLTLDPSLMESLQQTLRVLPSVTINVLHLSFYTCDLDCRNPPSDEAMLATATQLASAMSRIEDLNITAMERTCVSITRAFLAACRQLQRLTLDSCALPEAVVQAIFSVKSLREGSSDERYRLLERRVKPCFLSRNGNQLVGIIIDG